MSYRPRENHNRSATRHHLRSPWQQHGVLKVTLINKLMILGYHLGAPPECLSRFYRDRRAVCDT